MKRAGRSHLAALVVASFLALPAPADALMITEIMAINHSTIADEDGEFSDWLEIHNATGAAVRLGGWSLTDDPESLDKWTFPDVALGAGRFLVVAEAQVRNFERWPLDLGEHGWQGKVDALKQWMLDRVAWIDTRFIDAPLFSREGGR